MTSQQPRLMLIDGHSMAFRAFFALPAENFSTTGGQTTNAVYGFTSMLITLLAEEQPTHVAVAFDVGRQTFRSEMFPAYKAQRDATPPEFKGQVGLIKEVLDQLGIVSIEKENFEADDIIATLATQARPLGFETLIVTGDRDSFQLVNDSTTVLYPMRGVSLLHRFTPAAVEEKYGLTPAQYPEFAALRGDPSDNLPNVPGVGEKTATKWIVKYETLENLLDHADEIKGKVGDSLRERIEQVRMNRKLTEMVKDLELPYGPDELERREANLQGINDIFDHLEFGVNLRERVVAAVGAKGQSAEQPESELEVVISEEPLGKWLAEREGQPIAMALRGDATPAAGDVTELALVDGEYHGIGVSLEDLNPEEEKVLVDWLESDSPKIVHQAKAAIHMLRGRGFEIAGIAHDTAIAAYLNRPWQHNYDLEDIYQRHLQVPFPAPKEEAGQLTLLDLDGKRQIEELVYEGVAIYQLAVELSKALTKKVTKADAEETNDDRDNALRPFEVYQDLELPLARILADMEHTGIQINVSKLEDQLDEFDRQVEQAESRARELVNEPDLNLSSPKQLQVVLFETLGLPKTKKIKTGYSTAAKEIEMLAEKHPHPFLNALLEHREYQKLKTIVEGLLKYVRPDGKIHSTLNQNVASTGRLSSTEPNLQNIPVRTETGRRIRSAFEVSDGFETLLTADYSQIEMRVLANGSEDPGLLKAFGEGVDLHNYVGAQVFDVPMDEVTPELRRRVKALSYGLVYGLSTFGLSKQLDIPAGEAKQITDDYFKQFKKVKKYLAGAVEKAKRRRYTETLFGRRRYLPDLYSDNRAIRENAERAALNAPIQGTASDIIKVAMIRVDKALREANVRSRLLLQIHDELMVEVAPGELEQVRELVERAMREAVELRVPLEVSVGVGKNWDAAGH